MNTDVRVCTQKELENIAQSAIFHVKNKDGDYRGICESHLGYFEFMREDIKCDSSGFGFIEVHFRFQNLKIVYKLCRELGSSYLSVITYECYKTPVIIKQPNIQNAKF